MGLIMRHKDHAYFDVKIEHNETDITLDKEDGVACKCGSRRFNLGHKWFYFKCFKCALIVKELGGFSLFPKLELI